MAGEPSVALTPTQQPPDRVAEFVAAAALSGNEFAAAVAANLPRYLR